MRQKVLMNTGPKSFTISVTEEETFSVRIRYKTLAKTQAKTIQPILKRYLEKSTYIVGSVKRRSGFITSLTFDEQETAESLTETLEAAIMESDIVDDKKPIAVKVDEAIEVPSSSKLDLTSTKHISRNKGRKREESYSVSEDESDDLTSPRVRMSTLIGNVAGSVHINKLWLGTADKASKDLLSDYYRTQYYFVPTLFSDLRQKINESFEHPLLVKREGVLVSSTPSEFASATEESKEEINLSLADKRLQTYEGTYWSNQFIELANLFTDTEKSISTKAGNQDRASDLKPTERVLITGKAGIGKSTLCQAIAYRWGIGKLWKNVEKIYWIRLSGFVNVIRNENPKTLAAAIADYFYFDPNNPNTLKLSEESIQQDLENPKVLFLLDGFDEVFDYFESFSQAGNYLRKLLSQPFLLLTTRLGYIPQRLAFDKKVELLGLSEQQLQDRINGFVESLEGKNDNLAASIFNYIKCHHSFVTIAHSPVQLEFLLQAFVLQPKTAFFSVSWSLTGLFTKMLGLQLSVYSRKKLRRNLFIDKEFNWFQLNETWDKIFAFLSHIAFVGIQQAQQLIDETMIRRALADVFGDSIHYAKAPHLEMLLKLGLLNNVSAKGKHSRSREYYFAHLIFQEFFVAVYLLRGLNQEYINHQTFQKVVNFIEAEKYQPKYRMVFRFLAGLLSEENKKSITSKNTRDKYAIKTDFSKAFFCFWDALLCSAQDLIGLQKLDLWLACLSELQISEKFKTRFTYIKKEIYGWLDAILTAGIENSKLLKAFQERLFNYQEIWSLLELPKFIVIRLEHEDDLVRSRARGFYVEIAKCFPELLFEELPLKEKLELLIKQKPSEFLNSVLTTLSRFSPKLFLKEVLTKEWLLSNLESENVSNRNEGLLVISVLIESYPEIVSTDNIFKKLIFANINSDVKAVDEASLNLWLALSKNLPHIVIDNPCLLNMLRDEEQWSDKVTRWLLFEICRNLCITVPNEILKQKIWIKQFQTWVENAKNIGAHDTGLESLVILARAIPGGLYEDDDFIRWLMPLLSIKNINVCLAALRILNAFCEAIPDKVFKDETIIEKFLEVAKNTRLQLAVLKCIKSFSIQNPILFNEETNGIKKLFNESLVSEDNEVRETGFLILHDLLANFPEQYNDYRKYLENAVISINEDSEVYAAALTALVPLAQLSPAIILNSSDLLEGLNEGFLDDDKHVKEAAQQVLKALIEVVPLKILDRSSITNQLNKNLESKKRYYQVAGLVMLKAFSEGVPIWVLGNNHLVHILSTALLSKDKKLHKLAKSALRPLLHVITAERLLQLPTPMCKFFVKQFFSFAHPAILMINADNFVLQINNDKSLAKLTSRNEENLRAIMEAVKKETESLYLPENAFNAVINGSAVMERWLSQKASVPVFAEDKEILMPISFEQKHGTFKADKAEIRGKTAPVSHLQLILARHIWQGLGELTLGRDVAYKENSNLKQSDEITPEEFPEGLKRIQIPADGDCFFKAVSLSLEKDEDVKWLRGKVSQEIVANKDDFVDFISLSKGETFEDYIKALRDGNGWVGDLEITVLMKVLNRPILIVGYDGLIRNQDAVKLYEGKSPIFVLYNGHDHYDALLSRKGFDSKAIVRTLLSKISNQQEIAAAETVEAQSNVPWLKSYSLSDGYHFVQQLRAQRVKHKSPVFVCNPYFISAFPEQIIEDSLAFIAEQTKKGSSLSKLTMVIPILCGYTWCALRVRLTCREDKSRAYLLWDEPQSARFLWERHGKMVRESTVTGLNIALSTYGYLPVAKISGTRFNPLQQLPIYFVDSYLVSIFAAPIIFMNLKDYYLHDVSNHSFVRNAQKFYSLQDSNDSIGLGLIFKDWRSLIEYCKLNVGFIQVDKKSWQIYLEQFLSLLTSIDKNVLRTYQKLPINLAIKLYHTQSVIQFDSSEALRLAALDWPEDGNPPFKNIQTMVAYYQTLKVTHIHAREEKKLLHFIKHEVEQNYYNDEELVSLANLAYVDSPHLIEIVFSLIQTKLLSEEPSSFVYAALTEACGAVPLFDLSIPETDFFFTMLENLIGRFTDYEAHTSKHNYDEELIYLMLLRAIVVLIDVLVMRLNNEERISVRCRNTIEILNKSLARSFTKYKRIRGKNPEAYYITSTATIKSKQLLELLTKKSVSVEMNEDSSERKRNKFKTGNKILKLLINATLSSTLTSVSIASDAFGVTSAINAMGTVASAPIILAAYVVAEVLIRGSVLNLTALESLESLFAYMHQIAKLVGYNDDIMRQQHDLLFIREEKKGLLNLLLDTLIYILKKLIVEEAIENTKDSDIYFMKLIGNVAVIIMQLPYDERIIEEAVDSFKATYQKAEQVNWQHVNRFILLRCALLHEAGYSFFASLDNKEFYYTLFLDETATSTQKHKLAKNLDYAGQHPKLDYSQYFKAVSKQNLFKEKWCFKADEHIYELQKEANLLLSLSGELAKQSGLISLQEALRSFYEELLSFDELSSWGKRHYQQLVKVVNKQLGEFDEVRYRQESLEQKTETTINIEHVDKLNTGPTFSLKLFEGEKPDKYITALMELYNQQKASENERKVSTTINIQHADQINTGATFFLKQKAKKNSVGFFKPHEKETEIIRTSFDKDRVKKASSDERNSEETVTKQSKYGK